MAHQILTLLNELKALVLAHAAVHQVSVRGEEVTATRGYLRMRVILQSQDVVEIFVYLIEEGRAVRLKNYSLHWQRVDGTFIQRWDNAPHHPELASFPHHTHRAAGGVETAAALDWAAMITLLEREVLEKTL